MLDLWITGAKQWPLGNCPPRRLASSGGEGIYWILFKSLACSMHVCEHPGASLGNGFQDLVFECLII